MPDEDVLCSRQKTCNSNGKQRHFCASVTLLMNPLNDSCTVSPGSVLLIVSDEECEKLIKKMKLTKTAQVKDAIGM